MIVLPLVYHELGYVALEVLAALGLEVPIVVTHKDKDGENIWFPNVADLAREQRSEVFYSEDLDDSQLLGLVERTAPDIILSVYFRRLVREEIIAVPRLGAVNLHGSLLPEYRGRAPVNWQIINGETEGGLTLHYMVRRADAGAVIGQTRVPIAEDDTALTLYKRLAPAARQLLTKELSASHSWRDVSWEQDEFQATSFRGRKPEDGVIDWTRSSEAIFNLVRGVTRPYPGAYSRWDGDLVMVWTVSKARPNRPDESLSPGSIFREDEVMYVRTGDGWLRLIEIEVCGADATGSAIDPNDISGFDPPTK
ncbi:hypothetical protein JYT20_00810 [Rhodothermus sp. AH-315-K08]|nr:hypothetical protein [Rhodothermus sp. AH-315-K08]